MLEAMLFSKPLEAVPDSWANLGDVGVGRRDHSVTVLGEWLYIFGGILDGSVKTNDFVRYNLETKVVEQLPVGPSARSASQMASVNGLIYLYGGAPGTPQRSQDFWTFDPNANVWTQLPDGPNVRERGALVEVGGLLYLVGGRSVTEPIARPVQCYDPISGTWTTKAEQTQVRYDPAVVAIGTMIYMHGGFASADTNMLWVYDTVNNTWGVLAPNTGTGNSRSEHWAGTADGKLYTGGGNSQTNNDVYMYDPESNVWSKRKAHLPRQLQAGFASYRGKIYVHGNSVTPHAAYLWEYTP